jgi:hypothetical protein
VPHSKPNAEGFKVYRSSIRDCRPCPLRAACFSPNAKRRTILLHKDHPALLRARRRHLAWTERERILYASHRARVEGVHREEKAWHGLARAVRRGLANMKIQAYLTAAAVNLKRLAAAIAFLLMLLLIQIRQSRSCTATGRLLQRPRLYASHLLSGRPCPVSSGAISKVVLTTYCSAIAERCCAFGELGSSQVPTSRQCGFVELARDNLTYGFSFSALMRPVSRD